MWYLHRIVASVIAIASCLDLSTAQSLSQLRFTGMVGARGGLIELAAGVLVEGTPRTVEVGFFVGPNTSAGELAQILKYRLEREGLEVLSTSHEGSLKSASLFIEHTMLVKVLCPAGLNLAITSCEGPPLAVRMSGHKQGDSPLKLTVSVGAISPHSGDTTQHQLVLEVAAQTSAPAVANQLLKLSAEQGWVTDRPKPDRWRLVKLVDGSTITGATIFFRSSGQWRMEVEFPRGP